MSVNELIAENTKLKRLIQLYEKNCKIVADTTFKMSEMILNLKGLNERLQFELDLEKRKNDRHREHNKSDNQCGLYGHIKTVA